jgi:hypothetical protein
MFITEYLVAEEKWEKAAVKLQFVLPTIPAVTRTVLGRAPFSCSNDL